MSRGHYVSRSKAGRLGKAVADLVNEGGQKERVVLNDDARRYANAERESVPKGRIDTGRGQ